MNGMPSRYKTRAFARLAGVTVKTLYHYERRGLLRPARTASRYRTYTATDLRRIREIQALRFLGFTLGQITQMLRARPEAILDALRAHRRVVEAKRTQLTRAATVLEQAEAAIRLNGDCEPLIAITGRAGWAMRGLKYGEGDIVRRPPDRVSESKRLLFRQCAALLGEEPASAGVQAAVTQWNAMIAAETGGDPDIAAAVAQAWKRRSVWPAGVKEWVAGLYETDADTWARVADLIDLATLSNPK